MPQDQAQSGCVSAASSSQGPAVAGARSAQVLPTPEPAADPPAVAAARAAPRGGDPTLDMTLPLLGGGGGSLAAGLWLLMRARIRLRRR
jgi:hypothetical protein